MPWNGDPRIPDIFFERRGGGDCLFWAHDVGPDFLAYIERQPGSVVLIWHKDDAGSNLVVWIMGDALGAVWFLRKFTASQSYFPGDFEPDYVWVRHNGYLEWVENQDDEIAEATWQHEVGPQGLGSTGCTPMWHEGQRARPHARPRRCNRYIRSKWRC